MSNDDARSRRAGSTAGTRAPLDRASITTEEARAGLAFFEQWIRGARESLELGGPAAAEVAATVRRVTATIANVKIEDAKHGDADLRHSAIATLLGVADLAPALEPRDVLAAALETIEQTLPSYTARLRAEEASVLAAIVSYREKRRDSAVHALQRVLGDRSADREVGEAWKAHSRWLARRRGRLAE